MGDTASQAYFPGVVVIDMSGIVVARQFDECGHVATLDATFEMGGLADLEVLEATTTHDRLLPSEGALADVPRSNLGAPPPPHVSRIVAANLLTMARLDEPLRALLGRLEREATLWREEPIRRVAVRNKVVHPLRVRQFHAFGRNSFVDRPVWLYGTHHMAVGDEVIILKGAWLSVERPAWDEPAPALVLGHGVGIRVGCTLSAAESVLVEDHVGMGAYVTVVDSRHTWANHPNTLYNPAESAPIRIGKGSWLADRVTVAAGAEIGEQCAVGPNSTVSGRIPDYSIVLGNPGRVVGSTRT